MTREWRIVSKRVFGTFRTFGEGEDYARRELTRRGDKGDLVGLANDPIGPYELQSRPLGTQGNDSTWTSEP